MWAQNIYWKITELRTASFFCKSSWYQRNYHCDRNLWVWLLEDIDLEQNGEEQQSLKMSWNERKKWNIEVKKLRCFISIIILLIYVSVAFYSEKNQQDADIYSLPSFGVVYLPGDWWSWAIYHLG